MASDLNAAVEAATRLIQMLDGVRTLADALTQIGSLDQALRERKAAFDKVEGELSTARAAADAELEVIRGQVASASAGLQAAHAQRDSVLATGRAEAEAVVAKATAEVEQFKATAQAALDETLTLIADKEVRLAEVTQAADAAEARLRAAQKQFAALAAKFGA